MTVPKPKAMREISNKLKKLEILLEKMKLAIFIKIAKQNL